MHARGIVRSLTVCAGAGAVTTCPNGLAALDKLRDRSDHFDLVLSDVYMPGVQPHEALPCKLSAAERAAKCATAEQPNACLRCHADMDGFKLLEHIGLELGLPVISAPPPLPLSVFVSWVPQA